jgi:hypothetical protein
LISLSLLENEPNHHCFFNPEVYYDFKTLRHGGIGRLSTYGVNLVGGQRLLLLISGESEKSVFGVPIAELEITNDLGSILNLMSNFRILRPQDISSHET